MADLNFTPEQLEAARPHIDNLRSLRAKMSPEQQAQFDQIDAGYSAADAARMAPAPGKGAAPRRAGDVIDRQHQRGFVRPPGPLDPEAERDNTSVGDTLPGRNLGAGGTVKAAGEGLTEMIPGVNRQMFDAPGRIVEKLGGGKQRRGAEWARKGFDTMLAGAVPITAGVIEPAIDMWQSGDEPGLDKGKKIARKASALIPMLGPMLERGAEQVGGQWDAVRAGRAPSREEQKEAVKGGVTLTSAVAAQSPYIHKQINNKIVRPVSRTAGTMARRTLIKTPERLIQRIDSGEAHTPDESARVARTTLDRRIPANAADAVSGSSYDAYRKAKVAEVNVAGKLLDDSAAVLDQDGKRFDVRQAITEPYQENIEWQERQHGGAAGKDIGDLISERDAKLKYLADETNTPYQTLRNAQGAVTGYVFDQPIPLSRTEFIQAYRDLAGGMGKADILNPQRSGTLKAAEQAVRNNLSKVAQDTGLGQRMMDYHRLASGFEGYTAEQLLFEGGKLINDLVAHDYRGVPRSFIRKAFDNPSMRTKTAYTLDAIAKKRMPGQVAARRAELGMDYQPPANPPQPVGPNPPPPGGGSVRPAPPSLPLGGGGTPIATAPQQPPPTKPKGPAAPAASATPQAPAPVAPQPQAPAPPGISMGSTGTGKTPPQGLAPGSTAVFRSAGTGESLRGTVQSVDAANRRATIALENGETRNAAWWELSTDGKPNVPQSGARPPGEGPAPASPQPTAKKPPPAPKKPGDAGTGVQLPFPEMESGATAQAKVQALNEQIKKLGQAGKRLTDPDAQAAARAELHGLIKQRDALQRGSQKATSATSAAVPAAPPVEPTEQQSTRTEADDRAAGGTAPNLTVRPAPERISTDGVKIRNVTPENGPVSVYKSAEPNSGNELQDKIDRKKAQAGELISDGQGGWVAPNEGTSVEPAGEDSLNWEAEDARAAAANPNAQTVRPAPTTTEGWLNEAVNDVRSRINQEDAARPTKYDIHKQEGLDPHDYAFVKDAQARGLDYDDALDAWHEAKYKRGSTGEATSGEALMRQGKAGETEWLRRVAEFDKAWETSQTEANPGARRRAQQAERHAEVRPAPSAPPAPKPETPVRPSKVPPRARPSEFGERQAVVYQGTEPRGKQGQFETPVYQLSKVRGREYQPTPTGAEIKGGSFEPAVIDETTGEGKKITNQRIETEQPATPRTSRKPLAEDEELSPTEPNVIHKNANVTADMAARSRGVATVYKGDRYGPDAVRSTVERPPTPPAPAGKRGRATVVRPPTGHTPEFPGGKAGRSQQVAAWSGGTRPGSAAPQREGLGRIGQLNVDLSRGVKGQPNPTLPRTSRGETMLPKSGKLNPEYSGDTPGVGRMRTNTVANLNKRSPHQGNKGGSKFVPGLGEAPKRVARPAPAAAPAPEPKPKPEIIHTTDRAPEKGTPYTEPAGSFDVGSYVETADGTRGKITRLTQFSKEGAHYAELDGQVKKYPLSSLKKAERTTTDRMNKK